MPDVNPFTQVYNALWTLVRANPALTAYIRPGNQIDYDGDGQPKVAKSDGDFPELSLIHGTLSNLRRDTHSTGVSRQYIWQLATGDLKHPLIGDASFELFRSMIDYEMVLCSLLWNNCTFVFNSKIVSEDIGTLFNELNQGVDGWASLMTIEVDFIFNTNALRIPVVP